MKTWIFIALMSLGSFVYAAPITHVFSGTITDVGVGAASDWRPEIGDRYHGVMTYDTDQIIYNSSETSCVGGAPLCGGLVSFEIALGEKLLSYNPTGAHLVQWNSETGSSFTAYLQVVRYFDTFNFDQGSFFGVDADFFEHMAGEGDVWVQVPTPVPEPAPLALIALSLMTLGLRRYWKGIGFRLTDGAVPSRAIFLGLSS